MFISLNDSEAVAENTTSVELLSAVLAESCITLIINLIATTCIAISLSMPNLKFNYAVTKAVPRVPIK